MAARLPTLRPATVPAALLLLLAIAGGLAARVRAAERSHRASVEQALHDYAEFAAWRVARSEEDWIGCLARSSTYRASSRVLRSGEPLPSAALLDPDSADTSCGFAHDTRLAFRITVHDDVLTTSRHDTAAARLVARLAPALVAAAAQPARIVGGREESPARLRFDTLGGVRVGIAYALMRDSSHAPRAVYGVVGTVGARVADDVDAAFVRGTPLLPPSIAGGLPNDRALRLDAAYPDGAPAYGRGVTSPGEWAAVDTMSPAVGGLVVRVALAPAVADALLARRLPGSGLPFALALLAGAAVLAVIALAQLRRARELERLRTRFVADVSHELRTPLAHIALFSETLARGRERSAEERRHFAATILRETRRLTMLVDGVLRFSRGGAVTTRRGAAAPRDLAAAVRDAAEAFAPLATAEGVAVELSLGTGAWACADAGAVRQIVFNLLDNAVKYGPRGQRVSVAVARDGSEVLLRVSDEGPGVPAAERERVFAPFVRLERPGLPHVTGTGIGLAVVHDLVTELGGRVWIDDAPHGRGARVTCALPGAAVADAAVPETVGPTTAVPEAVVP